MIPENLRELIHNKYEEALANGSLHFTESTSKKVKDPNTGIQYYVTYAPTLQNKPERGDKELESKDPFAAPDPALTVLESVCEDYKLLLNKFPVSADHALLVTKEFAHQSSPLSPKDLLTSYQLLAKLDDEDEDERFMVFYNCGPNSGSSVDHKHLQLLRLPQKFTPYQDKLCKGESHFIPGPKKEALQDSKSGFCHYVVPMPEEPSEVDEETLAMSFISLLQRALTSFQNWTAEKPDMKMSYNFMMTKDWMCVVPRSKASSETFSIGFNATGYAGLILVKREEVFKKLTESPEILDKALQECSFTNTSDHKPDEYEY